MAEPVIRVPYNDVLDKLNAVLAAAGLSPEDAELCARLFADASRDGVPSHGLNRFASFVRSLRDGSTDARARPVRVAALGALEQWDGQLGPGPLNAWRSMARALELAREHGIGCVALRRTNHWMRAGSYGWQAAEAGMIGICWTNAGASMPPWGSSRVKLGNNPIVFAVPRPGGHLVLDMAMSQYSMGRLDTLLRSGEHGPVPGGYDARVRLTADPAAILHGGRPLPIGCWKGAGLALMLDAIAAALSGGLATFQVTASGKERSLSQMFIALDAARLVGLEAVGRITDAVVADIHEAAPLGPEDTILYPGERALKARQDSLRLGVPVFKPVWDEIARL
ncbi:MAG: 3-dehydro-L-gulonate 2-dehydrogenase [Phycisphaerae bacterium]